MADNIYYDKNAIEKHVIDNDQHYHMCVVKEYTTGDMSTYYNCVVETYFINGEICRKITSMSGNTCWCNKNDFKHRLDGPAVECEDSFKSWRIDGKRHRINGPARLPSIRSHYSAQYIDWQINLMVSYDPVMDDA